jgi:hypothetical protein
MRIRIYLILGSVLGFMNTGYSESNLGGVKESPRVLDYPASMYVSVPSQKQKKEVDWISNVRVLSWRYPNEISFEEADRLAGHFAELGVNVVFPERFRYLFGNEKSPKNWWNGMPFETYIKTMGTITRACHKHGIKVVAHLTACIGQPEDYYQQYPDHVAIEVGTDEKAYFKRYFGYALCLNNPGFLATYSRRLNEVLKAVPLDGLMVDEVCIMPPTGNFCGCIHCQDLFKKEYGYDIPSPSEAGVWKNWSDPRWRAWQAFRIKSVGRFQGWLRKHLDAYGSGKLYTNCYCNPLIAHNTMLIGVCFETLRKEMNIGFYECEPLTVYSWRHAMAEGRYARGFGPTFFLSYSKSVSQQFFSWAFSLCNGFKTFLWPEFNQNRILPLNWEKKWEDILLGQDDLCDVAILFSSPTATLLGKYSDCMTEYTGWAEALIEEHIPFRTVIASRMNSGMLRKYSLVILPDVACLSESEMQILRNYVNEGGTLIVTDESSLYDGTGAKRSNFGLSDVFGVTYQGSMPSGTFVAKKNSLPEANKLFYKNSLQKIKLKPNEKTSVFARVKENQMPAIVQNQYGRGRAIYLAFRPGLNYFMPKVGRGWIGEGGYWRDNREPAYKNLMIQLVRQNLLQPSFYVENIPQEIIVNPYQHNYAGYEGISIHLMNCLGARFDRSAQVPNDPTYEFLNYPSPKTVLSQNQTMKVMFKTATAPRRAYMISPDFTSAVALNVTVREDKYSEIVIPDLGRYAIIYVVLSEKDPIRDTDIDIVDKIPPVEPFKIAESVQS